MANKTPPPPSPTNPPSPHPHRKMHQRSSPNTPPTHPHRRHEIHHDKKRKQRLLKYLKYASIVIAIILATSTYLYRQAIKTPHTPESAEEISIIIKNSSTIQDTADTLEEKEIIDSSWAFYWYTRLNNLDTEIVAGRFVLSPSMTIPQILEVIVDATNSEAVITIQEGLRVVDIDHKLSELELIQAGEFAKAVAEFALEDYEYYPFLDKTHLTSPLTNPNGQTIVLDYPLEGYLYPDTYFLDPSDFDPTNLIYRALNNFKSKTEELLAKIEKSPRTLHEIVTMASILEKEVRGYEDQQLVSGILWKRLNSNWKLDADATLLYTKRDNTITTADLESDSPYNTRKFKGLPPGPIGNPSLQTIKAALYQKSSSNWFYLTDSEGAVHYANSNDAHNANKVRYLN